LVLGLLEQDGLADNTILCFMGVAAGEFQWGIGCPSHFSECADITMRLRRTNRRVQQSVIPTE
jgi:hypothetical protein